MKKYPSKLIRGISNPNDLNDEGHVTLSVFIFKSNPFRSDGKEELSVNWCDDYSKAVSIAMNQTKEDGSIQFRAGVAIIQKSTLDEMKKSPICMGRLDYERAPLDDNEFHGNITCVSGLTKQTRDMIRASLVLSVSSIVPRTVM